MRKKIKRLFSVLVAVVCMFSISSFANALEPVEEEPENHFILHESVTRSENIPTKKWDFNDGVYEGSFYGLRTGFYTNRYFTGTTSLKIAYSNVENSGPGTTTAPAGNATFEIQLYDITDGSWKDVYESSVIPYPEGEAISGRKTVSGLNTSHKYAFFFRNGLYATSYSQLRGEIKVSKN